MKDRLKMIREANALLQATTALDGGMPASIETLEQLSAESFGELIQDMQDTINKLYRLHTEAVRAS